MVQKLAPSTKSKESVGRCRVKKQGGCPVRPGVGGRETRGACPACGTSSSQRGLDGAWPLLGPRGLRATRPAQAGSSGSSGVGRLGGATAGGSRGVRGLRFLGGPGGQVVGASTWLSVSARCLQKSALDTLRTVRIQAPVLSSAFVCVLSIRVSSGTQRGGDHGPRRGCSLVPCWDPPRRAVSDLKT